MDVLAFLGLPLHSSGLWTGKRESEGAGHARSDVKEIAAAGSKRAHPPTVALVTMSFILEAVGHIIRNRMQNPKERDQWWNEHIEKTEETRKRWCCTCPLLL
jgi:hypothetical protein